MTEAPEELQPNALPLWLETVQLRQFSGDPVLVEYSGVDAIAADYANLEVILLNHGSTNPHSPTKLASVRKRYPDLKMMHRRQINNLCK